MSGQTIRCPVCNESVQLGTPTPPAELPEDVKQFAKEHRIDLADKRRDTVISEAAAGKFLEKIDAQMPEVSSAYQASGIFPASAFFPMAAGTVVGGVAGAVGLIIAAAVCSIVVVPIFFLNIALYQLGCIWFLARSALFIAGIVALLVAFGTAGAIAAVVVAIFSRAGKNRNANACATCSVIAAGLAVLIVGSALWIYAGDILATWGPSDVKETEAEAALLLVGVLGGMAAMLYARYFSLDHAKSERFCEECQLYMVTKPIQRLSLGGMKAVVTAIGENKLPLAASICRACTGEDGRIALSACPGCSKGYFEAALETSVRWQKGDQVKTTQRSRCVASVALGPAEVERLRAIAEELDEARRADGA